MNSFYGTRLAHDAIETIPTLTGKRTENFISLVDVYPRQFSGFYSTLPDVEIKKEDILLAEQDESEQLEHDLSPTRFIYDGDRDRHPGWLTGSSPKQQLLESF